MIQTSDSTPPGLYQSTLVITPVGASPPSQPDTIAITVHVVCNFRLKTCPELEIVDLDQGPNVVVSAPKPRQDTYIGRPMKLRVRHKAGTGTGQYTLVAGTWTLYGQVTKSYDITTGVETPLTAPDADNTISYYYVVSNNTSDYPIEVEATLQRDDGALSSPRTSAHYRAQGPDQPSLRSQILQGVKVGQYDAAGTVALSLGDLLSPLTVGISWTFSAGAPPTRDQGYVSATQVVKSTAAQTASPGATPPPAINTNGEYWLDSCPLYGDATQLSMFGPYLWTDTDSPASGLDMRYAMRSRDDEFRIFFMYRPSGPNAIWVPLGNLSWRWKGRTVFTNLSADDILLRAGWSSPMDAAWSADPTGQVSAEFPKWSGVMPYPNPCPVVPAQ